MTATREIAKRAQLNPKHAHAAVAKLLACGLLAGPVRPGATTVYELPSEFRNCSPTGEQFAANDRGMSLGHAPVAFIPTSATPR